MEKNPYDIAIVGSGISCSRTIFELAQCLRRGPVATKTLRIAVIEREAELWNGVPYGRRSAVGALTFQKLQEFLEEPERSYYIEWLVTNQEQWLKNFRERGGRGAEQWIADNQSLMEQGKWSELYLPRFLFGLYSSSEVSRSVDQLSQAGQASVTPIYGEAVSVARLPNGFHAIMVEDESGSSNIVKATRVVLAMGSPPQSAIHWGLNCDEQKLQTINNIYSPSAEVSIEKIKVALSSLSDKSMANLLIIGSNASSLEVLYLITHRSELRDLINSVVVLSRSGKLPYQICDQMIEFDLSALNSLRESSYFSATELMSAITSDIQRAEGLQLNIADLRDAVGSAVAQLTGLLPSSEQKRFVCEYGVRFSRMMRRAGRDTRKAADQLISQGLLKLVKGDLLRLDQFSSTKGLMSATYASQENQPHLTYPLPFSITINCGGFENLEISSSRLINSLIDNNLCQVNSTNHGFVVNERLEASKNVYVIGPLLGGNFNDRFRFWHVESASRIVGLAKLLAAELYESLFQLREDRHSEITHPVTLIDSSVIST